MILIMAMIGRMKMMILTTIRNLKVMMMMQQIQFNKATWQILIGLIKFQVLPWEKVPNITIFMMNLKPSLLLVLMMRKEEGQRKVKKL